MNNSFGQAPQVVDQQALQVKQVQQLAPTQRQRVVGQDGSRSPPQVSTLISTLDGELPRPAGAGNAQYRKARDVRRDPTVRMVRELAMAPLLTAEWEYEADPGAPEGAKELVEEVMSKMRMPLMRTALCGLCDYGWSPYEVIADQAPSGASIPRLKPLLQDLTTILVNAADGAFFGLRQNPVQSLNTGFLYLLEGEGLVLSQDVEGTNWYGESTLRSVERVYDEAEVINKSSRKYDAKIAGTHWVIYFPLGVSEFDGVEVDNGELARRLLTKADAVGGIIVPRSVQQVIDTLSANAAASEATQWKIELLSDKGQGQTPFIEKLKYLDVLKVRAFGFPERAILEGQFGTKAEAEAHADIAVSNLEVRHSLLVQQINAKVVDPLLLRWNYGEESIGSTRIKAAPLADKQRAFFQQLYMALLANPQSFMTELSSLDVAQVRDRLGLPELKYDPAAWAGWDPGADPYAQGLPGEQQLLGLPPAAGQSAAMAWDESEHPRDPGGEGGGQFVEKDEDWLRGLTAKKIESDYQDTHKERAKEIVKEAHKTLSKAGFVKVAKEKKHTASQKMGRSEAHTGSSDTVKTLYEHPDGRKAMLTERRPKFGTWIVSVKHGDVSLSLRGDVERAAGDAEEPASDGQAEAGNYRKGHVRVHGLDVCIETPRGKKRRGHDAKLAAHYGYVKRTDGADGDQVDVFLGRHPASEVAFVIDQLDGGGKFDEHKVMLGFKTKKRALKAYLHSYDDGQEKRIGAVTSMTVEQLKRWLRGGRTRSAVGMAFDESQHPRGERGTSQGGEFVEKGRFSIRKNELNRGSHGVYRGDRKVGSIFEAGGRFVAKDSKGSKVYKTYREAAKHFAEPDEVIALAYDPDQPRDPGGEGGGQWVKKSGRYDVETTISNYKKGHGGVVAISVKGKGELTHSGDFAGYLRGHVFDTTKDDFYEALRVAAKKYGWDNVKIEGRGI